MKKLTLNLLTSIPENPFFKCNIKTSFKITVLLDKCDLSATKFLLNTYHLKLYCNIKAFLFTTFNEGKGFISHILLKKATIFN